MLEISAWNQANALRQVTVKRGLDVRDFTLTTFGGSGSLLLCRLMDILGIPTVLVPPDPGNVSAFGLLTVDVKNDYVQTHVALDSALQGGAAVGALVAAYDGLAGQARDALVREGFAEAVHVFQRTADLRYFGQAFEVRVPVPDGVLDRAALDAWSRRFHAEHRALYGYDFAADAEPAGRVGQPPGQRHRPDHPARDPPADPGRRAPDRSERRGLTAGRPASGRSASTPRRDTSTLPSAGGPTSRPGRRWTGR